MKKEQGKLFIVSGPSGVGKTTIVTEFLQKFGQQYSISRVVTYTTKKPRVTEVHGIDYYFISQDEFDVKIKEKFFLEWSSEYGAYYGTPADILELIEKGFSFVLVIDRLGAGQIVKQYSAAVLIWIKISSFDMLSKRLHARKTDSLEQIQTRLFLAKKEIEQEEQFSMYQYSIDNNDLKVAVQALFDIVCRARFYLQNDIK